MTLRDKFDLLTLSTALGLTMLAFVLGVALITHGAVRLAGRPMTASWYQIPAAQNSNKRLIPACCERTHG